MTHYPFRLCLWNSIRSVARGNDGFSLIEVIIAIAILSLAGGAIFQMTSDSIRNVHKADAIADASNLAQLLLARVGTEIPLGEGELQGDAASGLRWRLRIQRYGDAEDRKQWPVAAYTVFAEVTVQTGTGIEPVVLRTLRLGPKEAQAWH